MKTKAGMKLYKLAKHYNENEGINLVSGQYVPEGK